MASALRGRGLDRVRVSGRVAALAALAEDRSGCGGRGAFAALLLIQLLDPSPLDAPFRDVASPVPTLPQAVIAPLLAVALVGVLAGLVAAAWAVGVRFRRATGIGRLQLKWLAYGACLIPVTLLLCLVG